MIEAALPVDGRMAKQTVMRVVLRNVVFGVVVVFFVARPAIRRRAVIDSANVALLAVRFDVRAGEREVSVVMIERGLPPVDGVVTDCAVVREIVLHVIGLLIVVVSVTRPAVGGCAVIDSADVAFETVDLYVGAGQLEIEVVVIEGRLFPINGIVTDSAVVREILLHVIGLLVVVVVVTRPAVGGCAVVDSADVALDAVDFDVRSRQLKIEVIVIEGRVFPTGGGVADGAIVRQALLNVAGLFVVGALMTGPTIGRRALIYSSNVAVVAVCFHVAARQRERGQAVVEGSAFPPVCIVTGDAVLRIAGGDVIWIGRAVILRFVAGPTVRRCTGELVSNMTLRAVGCNMRSCERKESQVVRCERRGGTPCRG